MLKALRCRSSLFAGANIGAFIGRSKFLRDFLLIFYRFPSIGGELRPVGDIFIAIRHSE
jgi:hypothetical protein